MEATAVIRRESQRLSDLLLAADPAAPVPTCPGWNARDLLRHLTEVHGFWAEVLASGARTDEQVETIETSRPALPEDLAALAREREAATAALVAQLEARRDEEPAWSWLSTDQSVGFTRRMQLHEATMHRVDAELTAGAEVTAPEEEISRDGIAHCVDVMWEADHRWTSASTRVRPVALAVLRPEGGEEIPLELSRTEGEQEPVVLARRAPAQDLAPGTALSALPRAEVTGSALALHLWCWGRGQALAHLAEGAPGVRVSGDSEATEALDRLLERGLQ